MRFVIICLITLLSLGIFACSHQSKSLPPRYTLSEFQLSNYLGKWYEIVRKENRFEKGLSQVTAEYAVHENGKISVINRGFNAEKQKWEKAVGKAKMPDASVPNWLQVSFFGPFYADYIVLDYDRETYQYALVRSRNDRYLWILSRQPQLDEDIIQALLQQAQNDGIPLENLVYTLQPEQP